MYPRANNQTMFFPAGAPPLQVPVAESLPQVQIVGNLHPERAGLEHYIHDRFAREYGANINQYMPFLIRYGSDIETCAAVGFRAASSHRLFLETYLDNTIERKLMDISGLDISREKIIEVGNLAATKHGASAPLFGALACFLDRIDYEWVVICATPTVQNVFSKLQIPLIRLAEACKERLPADQQILWGNYYDCRPLVMAVHVRTAHRCVKESAIGKLQLDALSPAIDRMVTEWGDHYAH